MAPVAWWLKETADLSQLGQSLLWASLTDSASLLGFSVLPGPCFLLSRCTHVDTHAHSHAHSHTPHLREAGPSFSPGAGLGGQPGSGCLPGWGLLDPVGPRFPWCLSEHPDVSPALPSRPPVGPLVSLGPG